MSGSECKFFQSHVSFITNKRQRVICISSRFQVKQKKISLSSSKLIIFFRILYCFWTFGISKLTLIYSNHFLIKNNLSSSIRFDKSRIFIVHIDEYVMVTFHIFRKTKMFFVFFVDSVYLSIFNLMHTIISFVQSSRVNSFSA